MRAPPSIALAMLAAVTCVAQTRAHDPAPDVAADAAHDPVLEPAADATHDPAAAPVVDPGAALPDDPAKVLVYARCNHCHGLEWIARSGGSEEGWTSRLRRMNRAGAMIPAEEMPILIAYLAKALPERPRPPPPPKRGISPRKKR